MLSMEKIAGMPECYKRWIMLRWENLTPEEQDYENRIESAWKVMKIRRRIELAGRGMHARPSRIQKQASRKSLWWPQGSKPIDAVDSGFRTVGLRDIRRY